MFTLPNRIADTRITWTFAKRFAKESEFAGYRLLELVSYQSGDRLARQEPLQSVSGAAIHEPLAFDQREEIHHALTV